MQARWGSHGDYEVIALSPDSPQEFFELTITAFNLSEKYRMPVLIMSDECVGHMTEKVVIPSADEIEIYPRRYTTLPPEEYLPFVPDKDLVPPMAPSGKGYKFHVTGLTHDEKGYPVINAEAQGKLVRRLLDKVEKNVDDIIITKEVDLDEAEIVIVSFGISSRVAQPAITQAKKDGIKIGHLRLITVWPFPEKRIRELASKIKAFVVPEINYGQIYYEVERCACGKAKVAKVSHPGGGVHNPDDIYNVIKEVAK